MWVVLAHSHCLWICYINRALPRHLLSHVKASGNIVFLSKENVTNPKRQKVAYVFSGKVTVM